METNISVVSLGSGLGLGKDLGVLAVCPCTLEIPMLTFKFLVSRGGPVRGREVP